MKIYVMMITYALCLSGSIPIAEYIKALTDVGFGTIEIRGRRPTEF
jgi:hypothetical protein